LLSAAWETTSDLTIRNKKEFAPPTWRNIEASTRIENCIS
jgi:hypothetical protein